MIEIDGKKYKTAIVHDWICNYGGAERVLESLLNIMPDSPVYIGCYMENQLSDHLKNVNFIPSKMQKRMNQKKDNHTKFLPYFPTAFESFDLNDYDIVISDSSCCAKGVITNPKTMHICYCHTPMRYAYEFYYEYVEKMNPLKKKIVDYFMNYMRIWDVVSSGRVDYYVANSKNVSNRIKKHYCREAQVIYPPVNIEKFIPSIDNDGYYLCVSRIIPHKKIDLVVEAFNINKKEIYIIGEGSQLKELQKRANKNVHFLGRCSDDDVIDWYARCKAFVFPTEEDFGITPVEAQASGKGVIAYSKGGALETVIPNRTGVFFSEQTTESLNMALDEFDRIEIDYKKCIENSHNYSKSIFECEMKKYIIGKWDEFNSQGV